MKSKFPRTLVTGANGMVGSYIDFGIKTDRKTLDVTDLRAVMAAVKKHKPKVILHLAALTDLDYCEKNTAEAYLVNSVGVYNVALTAREVGAKLVYISTAGIFDGAKRGLYKEGDLGKPQNHYGHSKDLGELAIRSLLKNYIIARACWMFGGGPKKDKKFAAKVIAQFDKPEIKALSDSWGSPTYAKDLIEALKLLIAKDARGTFHLAGKGRGSRYEVAKLITQTLKPDIRVIPVNGEYFNLPAKRVANEALHSKVNLMRPWREAFKEYLETEWKYRPPSRAQGNVGTRPPRTRPNAGQAPRY